MHHSRRKNCNAVNAASLARWIVMTAFLALAGLSYVYLTLQLYHLGERKKAIENELASLRTQNDVTNVQIAALTSRSALQRRLKEGYLKMIPISENNNVLAHNIPVETVVADATRLNNPQAVVNLLSNELDIPAELLAEKLNCQRRYIVIKREVPESLANALREKLRAGNLGGIYFEYDASRIYPNGSMLCHVIGFTDFEHHGIQGVEASMDEYLRGQDGYRYVERN